MAEAETDASASHAAGEGKRVRRPPKRKVVEQHARSAFDALARRDAEAIGEHWREDGVNDIVPVGVLRGGGEIVDFFRGVFTAVPDLETTVTRVVASDRLAAVEWRMTGNFTGGPFRSIEPTGKSIHLRGLDLLEIEDGEIVGNTAYYDGAALARQIGLLPPEGSAAERALTGALNAVTMVRKAVAERTGG
jgi:steroid delta-isomerase-like uncharacterized protein